MSKSETMAAANAAFAAGRLEEAENLCKRVLAADSGHVPAKLLLGITAVRSGELGTALPLLEAVLEVKPNSYEALIWLSILLRKQGELEGATGMARRAVAVRPDDAHGHNNLGMCLMANSHYRGASDAFSQASALKPGLASVHYNLGMSLLLDGKNAEAAGSFRRALNLAPGASESMIGLGKALFRMHDFGAAVELGRQTLKADMRSVEAHLLVANVLALQGKSDEAEIHLRTASSLDPMSSDAQNGLAIFLQETGRFEEAGECLVASLAAQPLQGTAYYCLVQGGVGGGFGEPQLAADEHDKSPAALLTKMNLVLQGGRLDPGERRMLEYALGKTYEDLGNYEAAMAHFESAHRITYEMQGGQAFDRVAYANLYDRAITDYDGEFLEGGSPSELPIFVVGMIRSGTTLTEQIISSHPGIHAAGEQWFWLENEPANQRTPETGLAQRYLAILGGLAPAKSRVTDKMPGNHRLLGLIHALLPRARIIHMRRNPADTCLSIYTTRINQPPEFGRTREDIVFAYRLYEKAMAHWRKVLPPESFLEVNYEDLVADGERVTREMISFCGLEWSDSCLHFEQNRRNVKTPSLWRVRKALDRTSVERWRKYEPWLGAFGELVNH